MGVLCEVQDEETHRTLTLEKLGLPAKDDPGAFERFRHDADVVAKLHHPNIAEIVEWRTLEDGSRCVAMERPDGEDSATRMKKGVLPWSLVSAVAEQVLTALEAAHQAGVIHGALTPQHIFLAREPRGRERCKLHGFGVWRIWHLYPHPSFAEERTEAAFYLSPEHAQGKTGELGPASDCFSFASILFELVTGQPPFSAASAGAIIYKIGHGRADSVLQHRPDAPPALDTVLARAWERDRERRLTAHALREELLAVLSSAQFLAGGSAEIRVQPETASAPSTLLLPEPLADATPNDETRQSTLPAPWSLAALRQRRWFWPAVGGAALLLLLLIVSMTRNKLLRLCRLPPPPRPHRRRPRRPSPRRPSPRLPRQQSRLRRPTRSATTRRKRTESTTTTTIHRRARSPGRRKRARRRCRLAVWPPDRDSLRRASSASRRRSFSRRSMTTPIAG